MKLRVSIPGAYMAMDLEDATALRVFRKTMEWMLAAGAAHPEEDASGPVKIDQDPEPVEAELDSEPVELIDPDQEDGAAEENEGTEKPTEEPAPETSTGYGGFLYIKCPDCGEVKGFCAKARIGNFRCRCGSVTKLHGLVPMFMHCECGRNARYLTNMTDNAFDVECYDCGAPVAVQWNEEKKLYETIQ